MSVCIFFYNDYIERNRTLKVFILFTLRYGEIFKTHILGCPCVMLASPEAAKFVLVTEAHLFKPTYPKSKERLIGPSALFFHQGDYHIRLRKLVQGSLSLDIIRNLVPHIEAIAVSGSDSWGAGQVINTFHEMKKVSLFLIINANTKLYLDHQFIKLFDFAVFKQMGWVSKKFCSYFFIYLYDKVSYLCLCFLC